MKTPGAPRSEPDRLLAMTPLAAVVRLAAPTTVVMAVSAVSNIVYTYFVSRLGVDAIGAVSLVFPVSLLAITAMGGGIGSGAASAVARALGAGRRNDAAALAAQALVLSVAIGLGFGLALQVCAAPLFRLMGASGPVLASATLFARVLFGGAAITFLGGMFDSVMRGEGNVRVPAVWSTTSLVLQMACTPLFMFGFGWGLVGAALAMLACQLVATVPRAFWVLGGRGLVRPAFRLQRFTLAPVREILRVGVPAALSTSISNVGLMALTAVVTRLGAADLAAYGLGTRLDFLLMSFGYGLSAAVLTLVGLATGADRHDRVLAFVTRAAAITVVLLGIPGLVFCWRPALWLGLFTDDAGIHAVGTQYFRIIGPSYPFVGVSMVIAFAFQGLGRATIPLAWMIARVVAVLAAAVVCTHGLGLGERAVFTTIATANVVSAAGLVTLFVLTERRLRVARPGPPAVSDLAATGTR
ncbi:MAG: MATE family efflux transporter [Deltaproteobacteria bacterium]|nr:MAG: MATE family efflux transporter [Deltaproteobacteria bacterium]